MNSAIRVLSAVALCAACAAGYAPAPVVFRTPAADEKGVMVLGNGEVGATAWLGADGTLHTVLQNSDSWNEGGRHVKTGAIDYETKCPVDAGTYRQELSMERGEFEAAWKSGGKAVSLRYRIQQGTDSIAVCDVKGAPGVEAKVVNWRLYTGGSKVFGVGEYGLGIRFCEGGPFGKTLKDKKFTISADRLVAGGWCHVNRNETVAEMMKVYDYYQATGDLGKPDLLSDRVFGGITRKIGGPQEVLFLTAVTCLHPCKGEAEWLRRTNERLDREGWTLDGEEAKRSAHIAWWRAFWNRSHIDVTPSAKAQAAPRRPYDFPRNDKLPVGFGLDSRGQNPFGGTYAHAEIAVGGKTLYSGTPKVGDRLPPKRAAELSGEFRFKCRFTAKEVKTPQRLLDNMTPCRSDGFIIDIYQGRVRAIFGKTWVHHPVKIVAGRETALEVCVSKFGDAEIVVDGKSMHKTVGRPFIPLADECRAITTAYAAQRYLTACAGRGRLPIRFNGSLFTISHHGDPDYRRWGNGYWWQNTRLPYYPMFAAGDIDSTDPLFRMYLDKLEFFKKRTKRYFGHGGAFFSECMQPWGDHFVGSYGPECEWKNRKDKHQYHPCHKYAWVGQMELSLMAVMRWQYTQDGEWFRKNALPAIREFVRYFTEHYKLDAKGRYHMYPAQAVETWQLCTNPMTEVAGLTRVTDLLLVMPDDVVSAEDKAFFAKVRACVPDLPTRKLKDGGVVFAPGERFERHGNVETPELYCVFPFRLSSFEKPNAEIGRRTYTDGRFHKLYFGWAQDELNAAYLGMAEEAREHIVERATMHTPTLNRVIACNEEDIAERGFVPSEYRWPAYWGPNYNWRPDQDEGGVFQNTIQSMLMQYEGDRIFLLPAWPKEWNCTFKLHAPRNTTVEGRVVDGELKDLVVTPASRMADVVVCGGAAAVDGFSAGGLGFPRPGAEKTLRSDFKTPPPGYGEVPFWWWSGRDPLDKKRMLEQIEEVHKAGISGVQVNYSHARSNGWLTQDSSPKLFSDEWWDIFGFVAKECAKRGMGISLSNYTLDFPYADNLWKKLGICDPEMRARELTMALKRFNGGKVPDFGADTVAVVASRDGGDGPAASIVARRGDALPAGKWTLRVISAAQKANTLDPLNKESGRRVVERFFNPFVEKVPAEARGALNYFFQDELMLTGGILWLWSPDYAEEFRRRKGYDIVPMLPALFSDWGPDTVKARLDMNDVMSAIACERYYKPIYDWHASRGLIYGCDQTTRGTHPMNQYIDYMRVMKHFTAPGFDTPGRSADIVKNKMGSSIAHLYRRPRVWLEGYHSQGWQASTSTIFDSTCHNYLYGSNLLNLHGLYYSTYGGWWEWAPPCYHFRMPYWTYMKTFLKYFERLSYILSQGAHVCDVAVVNPLEPCVYNRHRGNVSVGVSHDIVRRLVLEAQTDVDFIDADSIAAARVEGGRLRAADEAYRMVIMPDMVAVRTATLEKLAEFRRAGGIVVFLGETPKFTDTPHRDREKTGALIAELTARGNVLPARPSAGQLKTLAGSVGTPDFRGPGASKALHRRIGGYDVYFICDLKGTGECTFRASGRPELWNPWDGAQTALADFRRNADGTTTVRIDGDGAPKLVVFTPDGASVLPSPGARREKAAASLVLDGEWDFTLKPTLDNKWGDFRLPVRERYIGAEIRRVRMAGAEKLGLPAEMTVTYGPQFIDLGSSRPFLFSWREGAEGMPGFQDWHHGLNGIVGDDFFVLGPYNRRLYDVAAPRGAKPGVHRYETFVYAPCDCRAKPVSHGVEPKEVTLDGRVCRVGEEVVLRAGHHRLGVRYEAFGRAALVMMRTDVGSIPSKTPLSMRWHEDPAVLPFDPFGGKVKEGVYAATLPPACAEVEIRLRGRLLAAEIAGAKAEVAQEKSLIPHERVYRVRPRMANPGVATLTVRIAHDPGFVGGAAFAGPMRLRCGKGRIALGNWAGMADGLAFYSGGAVYEKKFSLSEKQAKAAFAIDLGGVGACCGVSLNGGEEMVLCCPPWRVSQAGAFRSGENTLRVTVYNTLNNHFQTIPTRYRTSTDREPSGLLGPVKVEFSGLPSGVAGTGGALMAVDAFGRAVPEPGAAGLPPPRADRKVGIFYFLWCGAHGKKGPYDVSKILAADPDAGHRPESPVWGGHGVYHHWGEPFYGYYYSSDEWVVRRHMKMMVQAGVDFLFFDTTNAVIYENNAKLVMRVLQEYHDAGWKTPKVMFYTNTASGRTVQRIYEAVYKPGYCRDVWFLFEGRPLIVAKKDECSEEAKNFFTFRASQWPNEGAKVGGWPWMDFTLPQRVFKNARGEPEVVNVSVAQHPQLRFGDSAMYGDKGNRGRAFHDGANDPAPDAWLRGWNFAEQFEHALKADPPVVLVTGWNEWIMGRWRGTRERPIMFVDCANGEYSRDIEMMRGGYGDGYFMQLVGYVRRYKGASPHPVHAAGAAPAVYDGFQDGGFARDWPGYGRVYENRSQRNAIRRIEMRHDAKDVHVIVRTVKPIDAGDCSGTWMKLYLNTDGGRGYGFVANNAPGTDGTTTLAKTKERGERLECVDVPGVKVPCVVSGDSFSMSIPRAALGIDGRDFTLWFKVADSRTAIDAIEDFYDHGDAAPLGRLNYVYKGVAKGK